MIKRIALSAIFAVSVLGIQSVHAQPAKVLVEMFTNTNCGNCKVPEEAYDAFMAAHPEFGIVRVVYHNEVTNPDDIFYVPAMTDVSAREQAYGLSANPLGIIDGFALGNNESIWENTTAAAASQTFPSGITITSTAVDANKRTIHVALTGSLSKQVRLYVALTESKIVYNNTLAYGNPNSGHWDDIFRAMLPTSNGTDAFSLTGSKSFDFTADLTDQDWIPANMKIVAFLQDATASNGGRQVEGLATVAYSAGSGAVLDEGRMSALTATEHGIQISLSEPASVSLSVRDILGRSVSEENLSGMSAGVHTLDRLTLRPGTYFVTAFANGELLGSCKIVR